MPFTASIVQRVFTCIPDKVIRRGDASWLHPLTRVVTGSDISVIRFY